MKEAAEADRLTKEPVLEKEAAERAEADRELTEAAEAVGEAGCVEKEQRRLRQTASSGSWRLQRLTA